MVKTKKRGIFDVEEVNALNQKYGEPLGQKHYLKYIGGAAAFCAFFATIFTYLWFVALFVGIFGAWYGYKYILPNIVKRNYFINSLNERNRLVNNLTQILTDRNKSILQALDAAGARSKGELHTDIKVLQASLMSADKKQSSNAFKVLRNKYEYDVVFTQYIEQVETLYLEGRSAPETLETLKEIKSYHNDMREKQIAYMKIKDEHLAGIKQLLMVLIIIIAALTFSFGFTVYFKAYARSIPGWAGSAIYLTAAGISLNKFRKLYFDNDIMSLTTKK